MGVTPLLQTNRQNRYDIHYLLLCSFFIQQRKLCFRLLEVIENEPTTTAASINEIRQKFSTNSQPMNGEQSVTKMEVDDTNSMKVNTPSRQSSAAALIS